MNSKRYSGGEKKRKQRKEVEMKSCTRTPRGVLRWKLVEKGPFLPKLFGKKPKINKKRN